MKPAVDHVVAALGALDEELRSQRNAQAKAALEGFVAVLVGVRNALIERERQAYRLCAEEEDVW